MTHLYDFQNYYKIGVGKTLEQGSRNILYKNIVGFGGHTGSVTSAIEQKQPHKILKKMSMTVF